MILTEEGLRDRRAWERRGYRLPAFDRAAMTAATQAEPVWLHFGPGNLFRAFQADACQRLLDAGQAKAGIIAAGRRRKAPEKNDGLFVGVTLRSDGSVEKAVTASVAETVFLYEDEERLREIFEKPSLQMVTFTITEKGYALRDASGHLLPDAARDLEAGPEDARSYMGRITALLRARYLRNGAPLAMVSMDNCSRNGDRLKEAVGCFAEAWGDGGFVRWLGERVTFPWTMIDKITPAPAPSVAALLAEDGLPEGTPFVNAEEPGYLILEDRFPNGRPCLEKAGFCFTDRDTVEKAERMKVCTCLNPLHTALAVFGCLLGFERIWQELRDDDLRTLAENVGYLEGLPAAADPGIIRPGDFLDEVLKTRFSNPFLPDTPQRIATDTSQKLPIRFGETIRAYLASDTLNPADLRAIPLVFAGWLRYLTAVDDEGRPFALSPDPLLDEVRPYVENCAMGDAPDEERIRELLRNDAIFGVNLEEAGLADQVLSYFRELTEGPGAVRRTLHRFAAGR